MSDAYQWDERLWSAAFGDQPGATDLTSATPHDAWLAGVALGGQGHYAAARARLDPLLTGEPALAALAWATLASHRRQLGGHAAARALDGRGAAALAAIPADHPLLPAARSDVLLGLAADALGLGRTALARTLLARAQDGPDPGWRGQVRFDWVSAEVDLVSGEAASAHRHASAACARAAPSTRHRAKSLLVLAAATAPGRERARLVDEVLDLTAAHRLAPLRWPALAIAAEAAPGDYGAKVGVVLESVLRHTDPRGRELARASAWVPTSTFVVAPNR
ncbi:hypothetical protein ACOBQX_13740 [Actinokineospora sp. G85]|uniref:hypothetical protein n=1 Tax=Actinokineospora sp. G85 TaxID=3406626 RepID=UPI003C773213